MDEEYMKKTEEQLSEIVELTDNIGKLAYSIGRDFLTPKSQARGFHVQPGEVMGIRILNSSGLATEEIRQDLDLRTLEYVGGMVLQLVKQATKLKLEIENLKKQS